jgi:hypothetical protein
MATSPGVTTDGRTIWVNSEGVCVGRFCPISGEVLDPTLGLLGVLKEDFYLWVARLKANWPKVKVDPLLRPEWALERDG